MSRNPIFRMIDEACGVPGNFEPKKEEPIRDPVRLVCERCKRSTVVEREPDFFDFAEIETLCPVCGSEADAG